MPADRPEQACFFPDNPQSPCPREIPTSYSSCDLSSLKGIDCAYSHSDPPLRATVCSCYSSSSDKPGYWSCGDETCRLDGDACLSTSADPEFSLPQFAVATDCNSRSIEPCPKDQYITAQESMNEALRTVLYDCGYGMCGISALLTVYFENGCATRFVMGDYTGNGVIAPTTDEAHCVADKLGQWQFDCAAGLECARLELMAALICY